MGSTPTVLVVLRRDHEVGVAGLALTASEPQMDQRYVAPALIDQGLQVGVALMGGMSGKTPARGRSGWPA
jgi:hypothetical protein